MKIRPSSNRLARGWTPKIAPDTSSGRGAAARVRRGVAAALEDGRCLTPDLGGSATTNQLAHGICRAMENS